MNRTRWLTTWFTLGVLGVVSIQADEPKRRLHKAMEWPRVDLAAYSTVFVEDCKVTDPEGVERKNQDLLQAAPQRMSDYIRLEGGGGALPRRNRRDHGRRVQAQHVPHRLRAPRFARAAAAGQSYYVDVLTMKEFEPKEVEKKLEDCELAWEIDATQEGAAAADP